VCLVPRAALSRTDGIRLEWSESHGHIPPAEAVAPLRASIRGLERPVFAYGWQFAEQRGSGNGDGRIQRGERMTMFLTLKNVGRGRTFVARANLKNLSGTGVLLHDARFNINDMMPGEERRVAFTFDVAQSFRQDELKLELVVEDEDLREVTSQKLRVPIAQAGAPVTAATGAFVAAAALELRESPASDARVILRAPAGSGFPITAQSGEWVRVDALDGRPGWALRAQGGGTRSTAPRSLTFVLHNSPPLIETDGPVALSVRGTSINLQGTATDENRVLDLYIFVGPHKVFYLSNRDAADRPTG
jgi:carboxyl-terminal processing protease